MPQSIDVTVVIPAYNAGEALIDALASVQDQTVPAHTIVVDDGSHHPVEQQLGPRYTNVTVYRQANAGAGAARNAGITMASTPFIAFLDADDVWLPEFLEHQLLVLRDFSGAAGSLAQSSRCGRASRPQTIEPIDFQQILFTLRGAVGTSGWCFRRDALVQAGCFDSRFRRMQDYELLVRLTGQGHTVLRNPDILFHYRPSIERGNHYGEDHINALRLFGKIYSSDEYPWAARALGRDKQMQLAALMAQRAANVALHQQRLRQAEALAQEAAAKSRYLSRPRRVQALATRCCPPLAARVVRGSVRLRSIPRAIRRLQHRVGPSRSTRSKRTTR